MRARLTPLFLAFLLVSGTHAIGRAQVLAPAPATPTTAADPWGFDDEVQVETWGDILRPQALDIGLTTALIAFALEQVRESGVAIVLETGTPRNVPLYERLGFEVVEEADSPEGGPHVWFMRRNP